MGVPGPGVIIDRYRVEGPIGAGSMGDVVKAVDVDLKRTVAIKILSNKHRGNVELEARFVREGRAVAAISHSNVVQVFTTGTFDQRPYIAMEFLTGQDLGSLVAQRGPMSSLQAAGAIIDSAKGLQAASLAGLIHRDVKPANLVMLDSGEVKVTDFGLAKPADPKSEPALTAMGVVVGTPDYIAPEQARGDDIDEKVDVYALGGTLYYLLVGKPPFRRGNPEEDNHLKVVARHMNEAAPNPMFVVADIDPQLSRLLLRLMAKKAKARPSYAELISELEEIIIRLRGDDTPTPTPTHAQDTLGTGPGVTSRTPFIGNKRQSSEIARLLSSAQVAAQSDRGETTDDGDEDAESSAETHLRIPSAAAASRAGGDESYSHPSDAFTKPKMGSVLIVTSLFSALVFLLGLGLYLVGPMPTPRHSAPVSVSASPNHHTVAHHDVTPKPTAGLKAAGATPVVIPESMLRLPRTSHGKVLLISKKLVTYAAFSSMFPNQKSPTTNRRRAQRPVTGVDFSYAQAFARTQGGRLPSAQEFAQALNLDSEDFATREPLWEWIDDGSTGPQSPRLSANHLGEMKRQSPRANANISFRFVLEAE